MRYVMVNFHLAGFLKGLVVRHAILFWVCLPSCFQEGLRLTHREWATGVKAGGACKCVLRKLLCTWEGVGAGKKDQRDLGSAGAGEVRQG